MPEWQMNEVMTHEFGANWRDSFQEFQERPFAAARFVDLVRCPLDCTEASLLT